MLADTLFFPPERSTFAGDVDGLFNFIYYLCLFFFVLIIAAMTYFAIKYCARPGHSEKPSPSHNESLEITWSVIPSILVGVIFFYGFTGYLNMREAPEDAYEIQVYAKKWQWSFKYPNGAETTELHLPAGKPVKFLEQSADVLHSFYIPAFRIKMDCVPGRYTSTWAIPNATTGSGISIDGHQPYHLFCAEYCGQQHSQMRALVYVHEPAEFEAWAEKEANFLETKPPAEAGAILFQRKGCVQCHSVTGDRSTKYLGPPLNGQWGTERDVIPRGSSTPEKVMMDENYVRESIRQPMAKIVQGRKPGMTVFTPSLLNDKQITAIIAYLKSLKDEK
ncbi:cytochrome c oxidase subunit II [bacterium]|nr:cytochrome c oxidase subunit II [bacterium]